MAATLLNASFASESDPDDGDFEDSSDFEQKLVQPRRRDRNRCLSRSRSLSAGPEGRGGSSHRMNQLWEAAQADARAVASKRPPAIQLDNLTKQFHRRHPRAPKQRSRRHIFAEVAKFCNVVADDTPPPPRAVELKRQVRSAAASARQAISQHQGLARPRPLTTTVEDTIRFAGETVKVQRVVPAGVEAEALQPKPKRRKEGSAMFDRFLGMQDGPAKEVTVMDKSSLDWQAHKHTANITDLEKDPHAGALERKEFLDRVSARSDAIADEARRDERRQAARIAKAQERR